jgi:hypothetical protein
MQPNEFNAFVAAIVSARAAELISQELAREVVEHQTLRFLNRVSFAPVPYHDSKEMLDTVEALNGRR